MRLISASLTAEQIIASVELVTRGLDPLKDITRRLGWLDVKAGERLQVCRKVMGRKKGEPLERLAVIEVVNVRREPLRRILDEPAYGRAELRREGFRTGKDFGGHFPAVLLPTPIHFVDFYCATHKGCRPETLVTRIEFKYVIHRGGAQP